MKKIVIILIGFLFALLSNNVAAKSINTKDKVIEIVVPYAPGGAATNVAHFVAEAFKEEGLETIVVNKPGNNAIIGANYVAKTAPTGHTLLIGVSAQVANLAFGAEGMEYTETSFKPIMILNRSSTGLVVKQDGPITNYQELLSYVKKNPDQFNIGCLNINQAKIWKEWARKENLPEPNIIIYKGSAQIMTDVASGTLIVGFDNFGWGAPMIPLIEAGKLKLIATFDNSVTKEISKIKNTVVDIAKLHPELRFSVWIGLMAPAGTPQDIITEINQIVNKAVSNPKFKDRVDAMDFAGGTPEQMYNLFKSDLKLLKKFANLK